MRIADADYIIRIEESRENWFTDPGHWKQSLCCATSPRSPATWSIYLLRQCPGGCACTGLVNHLSAVHAATTGPNLTGDYATAEEIPDPALRALADVLVSLERARRSG